MTIYDISQKAGVSIATVSRVLNGSDRVHPKTREMVMKVIRECDYTPNAFARGMGLHTIKTVGILCADSSDIYLAKAVYYLEQELHENGYESLLCCTGYNQETKKDYLNLILSKKVDAIILVGSNFIGSTREENQYIRDAANRIPILLFNAVLDAPNVYSTACDDYQSIYDTVQTMISSGIRDILYLYDSTTYSGKRKLQGYCAAMQDNQCDDYEKYLCFFSGNLEQIDKIADYVTEVSDRGMNFHGIIAANDSLAIASIKYAQRKGLRIPKDLSVVGYNNSVLTMCSTPELTSVDNRLEPIAHQLIQTMLSVLDGREMPTQAIFSGKLIKRGTTLF